MERKPGSTFNYNGKTYQVVAQKDNTCTNCAFLHWPCSIIPTGDCWDRRSDGTPVAFVQIDPVPEPQPKPSKRNKR